MSTGDYGAISVTLDPGAPVNVQGLRERQRRYWNAGEG